MGYKSLHQFWQKSPEKVEKHNKIYLDISHYLEQFFISVKFSLFFYKFYNLFVWNILRENHEKYVWKNCHKTTFELKYEPMFLYKRRLLSNKSILLYYNVNFRKCQYFFNICLILLNVTFLFLCKVVKGDEFILSSLLFLVCSK